jgi:hypothetical protein
MNSITTSMVITLWIKVEFYICHLVWWNNMMTYAELYENVLRCKCTTFCSSASEIREWLRLCCSSIWVKCVWWFFVMSWFSKVIIFNFYKVSGVIAESYELWL